MRTPWVVLLLGACDGGSSAAVDSAVEDAAISADAAPDAQVVVPLCERAGLTFCEDFEALAVGAASNATSAAWDVEGSGTFAIDDVRARGARSLKLTTTGNGRARLTKGGLALAGNSTWGVMHAWVSGFPTAPNYAHYTMVELGAGSGTQLRPIGGQYAPASGSDAAGAFWGVGSDGGPTGDWTNWRRTAPSVGGQWLCMEFHLDAQTSAIDVFIDGVAKPELSVDRTMHGGTQVDLVFPTIDRVWFGWWLYQANPTPGTYEVWLDDLALAPDRLGCE